MNTSWIVIGCMIMIALAGWVFRDKVRARPTPDAIKPGKPLPEFTAADEDGQTVTSSALRGHPTVLLFVRGSWCPFCSKQITNLAQYYSAITESGARLILITPKPLQTTRRVADIFGVSFEFWLDESLAVAKQLGLLRIGGVPAKNRAEYGTDTLCPTSMVVDAQGVIRHTEMSRFIADRPNPEKLLAIVRQLPQ